MSDDAKKDIDRRNLLLGTSTLVAAATLTSGALAQAQLSNLQSANFPEVLSNYSAAVTALQAAEEAFSRIQNLTLFSVLH